MTARMIPDRPPAEPQSERQVYLALQNLPDGWVVIHSVPWLAPRRNSQHDGEADFVLLHPDVGLIVLEAKGGGISMSGKRWYSVDRNGDRHRVDDPIAQARDSKHALLDYLRDRDAFAGFLPMGHGVAFPDMAEVPNLGPEAPPEILLSHTDLADPAAAVAGIVDEFDLHPERRIDLDPIVEALAPTVEVRHVLADDLAAVRARLLTLTEEQVGVLQGLRRNRRALIFGGAGTGKTVLALSLIHI